MKSSFPLLVLGLFVQACTAAGAREVAATNPVVRVVGRTQAVDGAIRMGWPGTEVHLAFEGMSCAVRLASTGGILAVRLDGRPLPDIVLLETVDDTLLAIGKRLRPGRHELVLGKRTEGMLGTVSVKGFRIPGRALAAKDTATRRIEFVGNSITAGFGVLDSVKEHGFSPFTEDVYSAWAARAAKAVGAQAHYLAYSGRGLVRNEDLTTEGTLPRLYDRRGPDGSWERWDSTAWMPDVVVVDLGDNDFARAPLPDSAAWEDSMVAFVAQVRAFHGQVPIILVDGPMMSDFWPLDAEGRPLPTLTRMRAHLGNVARRTGKPGLGKVAVLHLTPNDPKRGYGAAWHPNRAQAELNGRELTAALKGIMGW